MADARTVLVLGAGVGGVVAAHKLRELLPKQDRVIINDEREVFNGHGQFFIEIGHHRVGIGAGNFYAEPTPLVHIKRPSIRWHVGKVLFEKYWLWQWF
jgi:sulfide:quinone oxidoreductase